MKPGAPPPSSAGVPGDSVVSVEQVVVGVGEGVVVVGDVVVGLLVTGGIVGGNPLLVVVVGVVVVLVVMFPWSVIVGQDGVVSVAVVVGGWASAPTAATRRARRSEAPVMQTRPTIMPGGSGPCKKNVLGHESPRFEDALRQSSHPVRKRAPQTAIIVTRPTAARQPRRSRLTHRPTQSSSLQALRRLDFVAVMQDERFAQKGYPLGVGRFAKPGPPRGKTCTTMHKSQ